jgi:beta-lactam-binding protein with PASTA domain
MTMLGDSLRRRHHPADTDDGPGREYRAPRGAGGFGLRWWHWLGAAVVVLLVAFGVGFLLSTQVLFPRPDTAGAGIAVPSLYGENRAAAEDAVRAAGLAVGDVEELESMETPAGQVLAQAPLPGQQLQQGATVSFAVSAGPPELTVPSLVGLGSDAARALLERAGFAVSMQQVEDRAPAGTVVGSQPEPGTSRPLPSVVNLMVSAGAPGDTIPEPDVRDMEPVLPIDSTAAVGDGG